MSEALQHLQARLTQLLEIHKKTPANSAQHFSERVEIRVVSERIFALELAERDKPPIPAQ